MYTVTHNFVNKLMNDSNKNQSAYIKLSKFTIDFEKSQAF